jgi:hypothetical protein
VVDLKNEVNDLLKRLGEPPRYGGIDESETGETNVID